MPDKKASLRKETGLFLAAKDAESIEHFGAPLAEHVAAGDQKVDQTLLGHAAGQINVQLQLEQISVFGALLVVGAREADTAMPLVDALKQRGLVFVAALKARLKSDDAPAFGYEQVGGVAVHLPEQVAVFVKGAGIALFAGQVHELSRADLGDDKGHVLNDGRDGIGQLAFRQVVCHGDLSLGLRSQGLECTADGPPARHHTLFSKEERDDQDGLQGANRRWVMQPGEDLQRRRPSDFTLAAPGQVVNRFLNGHRPRANFQGLRKMTEACLKRKIRDCQQGSGDVPSNEKNRRHNQPCQPRKRQKCRLGRERAQCPKKPTKTTWPNKPAENGWACASSYKSSHSAAKTTARKSSDTMGMKHRVDHGVHIAFDAMSPKLAKRTGFQTTMPKKSKPY